MIIDLPGQTRRNQVAHNSRQSRHSPVFAVAGTASRRGTPISAHSPARGHQGCGNESPRWPSAQSPAKWAADAPAFAGRQRNSRARSRPSAAGGRGRGGRRRARSTRPSRHRCPRGSAPAVPARGPAPTRGPAPARQGRPPALAGQGRRLLTLAGRGRRPPALVRQERRPPALVRQERRPRTLARPVGPRLVTSRCLPAAPGGESRRALPPAYRRVPSGRPAEPADPASPPTSPTPPTLPSPPAR
jgi:hypothetical protein